MKTLIRFLSVLAAALCAPLAASAQAQWTPDRQVRIVVPFAAGAAADNGMRAISDRLAAALGQAVDPLKDFQPVSLMADLPLVLVVRSDLNIHSVRDLIQAAKAAPGKLTAGSSGNGSSGHLAVEMLKSGAGVNLLHVPYKGMPQAVTDMLGGRVDVTFSSLGPVMPHVKAGKLRVIGISTTKRFSGLPDIPTLAESGVPGFDLSVWVGLHYPAGVPQAAVRRVNAEVDKILQTPEVQARFKELGYVAVGGSTDVMATRIQSDYQRFGKLIRDARITAD